MTNAVVDVVDAAGTERRSRVWAVTVVTGVALAVALAALLALVAFPEPAEAQIGNFCGIINSAIARILARLGPFVAFIRSILNFILAAFGCGTISG